MRPWPRRSSARIVVLIALATLVCTGAQAGDELDFRPSRFNLTVNGGLGLVRQGSPYTLDAGRIAGAFHTMNFDRNPGDVDFFDYSFQGALGITDRLEAFGRFSPVLRTNSVGQEPYGYPVPPLDLFIDTYPSDARRPEPWFLFAQEAPFKTYHVKGIVLRPPGDGAFASSSGDNMLGLKFNLLAETEQSGVGLGVRGYMEFPTETPKYNSLDWRSLAGVSGERDWGLDLLFSKSFGSSELLANVGYKRMGDPDRGIRIQYVDSSKTDPAEFLVGDVIEVGLDLHDELKLGVGFTMPIFKVVEQQVWLLTEFNYTRYVAGGTTVERLVHPAELMVGLQINIPGFKNLSFGAAFQLLFNDAGDGGSRSTQFLSDDGQGDINFGELIDEDFSREVQEYFTSRGADFSYNSSKVFSTNNPEFDSWRNIPTEPQTIIGQGGGNVLLWFTWQFGDLW